MKRILLKLSGESLKGEESCIDPNAVRHLSAIIAKNKEIQIGIVIGGGNIFRGIKLESLGLQRTPADHIGMLATLMNGIALQQALNSLGISSKVMSAIDCPQVVERYNWTQANAYLNKGEVVIFVGGTGNPYFTTDTAAALRASEINADMLVKATHVGGVYNKDPKRHADAKKYETISYGRYLTENLGVMDATAVSLCMSNKIPIFVFEANLLDRHPLIEIISNPKMGTLISEGERKS